MKWTDGVPVTSQDVKWSWQAIMNPDNNVVSRHGYDDIAGHRHAESKHRRRTLEASASRRSSTTFFAESDQPYMIAPGARPGALSEPQPSPFQQRPVGKRRTLQIRRMDARRSHHLGAKRCASSWAGRTSNRVDVRIVPDEDTSVNLLRTHAIDYMFQASIENYPALRSVPDIRIVWVNVNGYYYVQLNLARPDLSDPRVRQAIAYAIDKNELVRTLTYGTQTVATADIPDWMWAFNPHVRSYPHDPARGAIAVARARAGRRDPTESCKRASTSSRSSW